MHTCTRCGCEWDTSGFYWHKGKIQQPCKACRLDRASIHRLNHRDALNEAWRTRYHANHEASKAYFRTYRAELRASA